MNLRIISAIVLGAVVLCNVIAVAETLSWLQNLTQIAFLLILLGLSFDNETLKKTTLFGFVLFAVAANLTSLAEGQWYFSEITLGLWLAAFVFLIMEAIKFTKYNRRNRYLHLYFLTVVGIYGYLFTLHILEIGQKLPNDFLFSMYLIYYVNLFILGVTALIYYLNSFSRKAVFFSCLALAFILSDVLRDMGHFYFRDLSVEIVGTLIKHAALALTFLFFITKEKKLRLLNLI